MDLPTFIRENMPEILKEWDAFARTLLPESSVITDLALRDHAAQMLTAIARDIEMGQTHQEQIDKSHGLADTEEVHGSAASIHGKLRHESDFSLTQLSAEFRALRSSVLRLWLPKITTLSPDAFDAMIRFNEAIDQALAESIVAFTSGTEQTRELFVGILGHDLRAPLATMMMSGDLLSNPGLDSKKVPEVGAKVKRSARLMTAMVDDLLGYTRIKMGVGLPMTPQVVDLADACRVAIDDASALHPNAIIRSDISGSLVGSFDSVRVTQLVTNLLKNAVQYGRAGSEIRLTARGESDTVTIQVNNHGLTIPEGSLKEVFQPLVRLSTADTDEQPRTSLGLGLYVAQQAAFAHCGRISVESSDSAGTTFTVVLPRHSDPR